jgi:hypothetical protein
MNKGSFISIFSVVAVFGIVTMGSASEVQWTYLTDSSAVTKGPGADGMILWGGDDADDTANAPGALSFATTYWDPEDTATCGVKDDSFMTGTEVDCLGTPAGGTTCTSLNVVQTETIPGTGTATIKLTTGGTQNTANNCGPGEFHATKQTSLFMDGASIGIPLGLSSADGIVYDASQAITADWQCPANSIVYPAAYLDTIRLLLPGTATGLMVICSALDFGPGVTPCLNNATSDSLGFLWTDDALDCSTPCEEEPGGCMAATALNVK